MIKRGVFAAGISIINEDNSLNIFKTVKHAENIISNGLHGVFFFGSTGQSQLISLDEKKELISSISNHRLKKNFFLGTGCNSLNENINLIQYSIEYGFNTFLLMPPAYYKRNSDKGIFEFYKNIISHAPKIKIILYNFEKLSGYLFNPDIIKKLKKEFPKNIIGCKDSSYNLYSKLKLEDFLIFPGSEAKLLDGLEQGCAGCISAVTNVTHSLARKVFDDFKKKNNQSINEKLILVRRIFDNYNLIPALHAFLAKEDKSYEKILPPLINLEKEERARLFEELSKMNFLPKKGIAA
tara:strand:- start:502 stop:1386 length:885 start_codon:yes stop_codon:yes gene_type:complete